MVNEYPGRIDLSVLSQRSPAQETEALTGVPYAENLGIVLSIDDSVHEQKTHILQRNHDSYLNMPWQQFLEEALPRAGFEIFMRTHNDNDCCYAIIAANTTLKLVLTAGSYDGSYIMLSDASVYGSFNDSSPSFPGSTYRALLGKSSLGPVGPKDGTQYEFSTDVREGLIHDIDAYEITNPEVADWVQGSPNYNALQFYMLRKGMTGVSIPEEIVSFTGISKVDESSTPKWWHG